MKDFLVVPSSHPFLMRDGQVIEQTVHFLRHGSFLHAGRSLVQADGGDSPVP